MEDYIWDIRYILKQLKYWLYDMKDYRKGTHLNDDDRGHMISEVQKIRELFTIAKDSRMHNVTTILQQLTSYLDDVQLICRHELSNIEDYISKLRDLTDIGKVIGFERS